jgi:hypothetical protein
MIPNLQIELRRFVSPNVVSKLSKFYNEKEPLLNKAIEASVATILIGTCGKIGQLKLYDDMMRRIGESEFYKEIDFDSTELLSVEDCYSLEGDDMLSLIFEHKKERITEMVSNETGVKSETAREVLNFSALLVLSYLKNKKQFVDGLHLLLEEQKRGILNTIPQGIKMILGFPHQDAVEEKEETSSSYSFFGFFSSQIFS